MFNQETVLVLGAGASCHYGFPSGEELIDSIVKSIKEGGILIAEEDEVIPFLEDIAARDLQEALEFYDPLSIDNFLSQSIHNQNLVDRGLRFIAYEILRRENQEKLKRPTIPTKSDIEPHNWYRFLSNALTSNSKPKDLIENDLKLSIITFNYDVSLEFYLYSRFSSTPFLKPEQSKKFLEKLNNNIVHIYGQVEKYKWQGKMNGRNNNQYGHANDDAAYKLSFEYQNNIKVMGRDRSHQTVLDAAREAKKLIESAKYIFFLGFGFNDDNIELLDLSNTTQRTRHIFCTNYGDSDKIRNKIYKTFRHRIVGSGTWPREKNEITISTKKVYQALEKDFDLIP